jgi:hypothetical protein
MGAAAWWHRGAAAMHFFLTAGGAMAISLENEFQF